MQFSFDVGENDQRGYYLIHSVGGSNEDKDKDEEEEDDVPKEPRLDGYFVVLGVIFVGTIVGVLVYFARK